MKSLETVGQEQKELCISMLYLVYGRVQRDPLDVSSDRFTHFVSEHLIGYRSTDTRSELPFLLGVIIVLAERRRADRIAGAGKNEPRLSHVPFFPPSRLGSIE